MKHVYAFQYTDVSKDDEELPVGRRIEWPEKHLVADSFDDAVAKARRFLVDDGLEGDDYQIISVRRLQRIDWPFETIAEPESIEQVSQ